MKIAIEPSSERRTELDVHAVVVQELRDADGLEVRRGGGVDVAHPALVHDVGDAVGLARGAHLERRRWRKELIDRVARRGFRRRGFRRRLFDHGLFAWRAILGDERGGGGDQGACDERAVSGGTNRWCAMQLRHEEPRNEGRGRRWVAVVITQTRQMLSTLYPIVDSASPSAPPPGLRHCRVDRVSRVSGLVSPHGLIELCVSLSMTSAARFVSGASMRRSAVSFSV